MKYYAHSVLIVFFPHGCQYRRFSMQGHAQLDVSGEFMPVSNMPMADCSPPLAHCYWLWDRSLSTVCGLAALSAGFPRGPWMLCDSLQHRIHTAALENPRFDTPLDNWHLLPGRLHCCVTISEQWCMTQEEGSICYRSVKQGGGKSARITVANLGRERDVKGKFVRSSSDNVPVLAVEI